MARILVIDDEGAIRDVLREVLEVEGHKVAEAGDGLEGLRLQRTSPAELVITDIVMPGRDGLEVIMVLHRESPRLKIIAMSGGGPFKQTEVLEMAEPLGAAGSLRKPFDLWAMVAMVERLLRT